MIAKAHRWQPDLVTLDPTQLLGHHSIGAGRQRRTGKDAHRLFDRQRRSGGLSGSDSPCQGQATTDCWQIRRAQGEAIHGAVVPARQVAWGMNIHGQHPAQGFFQQHGLLRRRRWRLFEQVADGLVNRHQFTAVTHLASHERSPQASITCCA
ncbi:hypothetical protein D3C81_1119750 [compost metagenome]